MAEIEQTFDRRTYAGDLGTDQVGRVIDVGLKHGGAIRDRLVRVEHGLSFDEGKTTRVAFESVKTPGPMVSPWFDVDPDALVTVLS